MTYSYSTPRFDELMSVILKLSRDSWPGETGEERASRVEKLILTRFKQYSEAFGYSMEEILEATEKRRDYSANNYYQEANFPSLDGVEVFASGDDFKKKYPSGKFRCPMCKGISTNPTTCNSGDLMSETEVCDWKAWGLFGTLGKGMRTAAKEGFLERPVVYDIFPPIELETREK